MRRACIVLCPVLAAVAFTASGARADQPALCSKSYESAQVLKKNREYLAARRELLVCIRECPVTVQRECTRWYEGLESVVPSIVIHAEADGEDRSDVRVEMDGKVLAERVEGKGIEVDPGQHEFTFTLAGFPTVKKSVVTHEAEQLRVLRVVFEKAEDGPKTAASAPRRRPVPPVVYVVGGIGVAGLVSFAAFGLVANAQRDHYEKTCAPRCGDASVNAIHTNYVLADVSLGIGLAALATGAVLWLTRPSVPAPEGPAVAIIPAPSGATLLGSMRF